MIFGGGIIGYYSDSIMFENIHKNINFHITSFLIGILLLFLI
jgi:hypothetical protein